MALLNLTKRRAIARKSDIFDDMGTARRLHGVRTAIMTLLRSFQGVAMRSYGVLIGDCLRFYYVLCASTALSKRSHGALVAHTLR
jgi:hypothetical protein